MDDVQGRPDTRGVAIDRAGLRGIRRPILVPDRDQGKQQTVGTFTLSVGVRPDEKGAHMSRFLEVLDQHVGEIGLRTVPCLLDGLRDRLRTERATIEVRFPYFVERRAPVSGARGLMDYDCWLIAGSDGQHDELVLGVRAPVTSVCPCSKAISDYGAHNQRAFITTEVRVDRAADGDLDDIWIEELVEVAEQAASAPVYPVLKRADERYVTMLAYENPVFVEDMVRDVTARLRADPRVTWFRVQAVSNESIHSHDAFAEVDSTVPGRVSP